MGGLRVEEQCGWIWFSQDLSMGHGFQWRGLGESLALTLKNMDREGTKVEAGRLGDR